MTHTEKILEEFDETFIAVEDSFAPQTHQSYPCFISNFQEECFKEFVTESIHQALAEDRKRVRGILEGMKRGIEFSEPRLYQHNPTPNEMGGYSSVPFMCSLCFMGEMDIQDNKLEVEYKKGEKEFEYACHCSVWDSPTGGKWVRWSDEDKARKLSEEYPCEDNFRNQALDDILASLDKPLTDKNI